MVYIAYLHKKKMLQIALCVVYPFLLYGCYFLGTKYHFTYWVFILLWLIYCAIWKNVKFAVASIILGLIITLPLVNQSLVPRGTDFDFFPYVDILIMLIAGVIQCALVFVRNLIITKTVRS